MITIERVRLGNGGGCEQTCINLRLRKSTTKLVRHSKVNIITMVHLLYYLATIWWWFNFRKRDLDWGGVVSSIEENMLDTAKCLIKIWIQFCFLTNCQEVWKWIENLKVLVFNSARTVINHFINMCKLTNHFNLLLSPYNWWVNRNDTCVVIWGLGHWNLRCPP